MTDSQNSISRNEHPVIIVTDCGSTTTKALLFEKENETWICRARGEAPTTVEPPLANVTIGAKNAIQELEELSGRKILTDKSSSEDSTNELPFIIRTKENPNVGIDLYLSTSSAGGGLQMVVLGATKQISAASAEKAALGAGAIVMDVISFDDGRESYERIQALRALKPDIVLIAGGIDGGTILHPIELAETVIAADPSPRFGNSLKLPVIVATNENAAIEIIKLFGDHYATSQVKNVRPTLDQEFLDQASEAVHDIFLDHVMSHAPGYEFLKSWTDNPIIPTPSACKKMIEVVAEKKGFSILAVDIGGATTDVFTAIPANNKKVIVERTVSANIGMSYSVGNVLQQVGEDAILRWLPIIPNREELLHSLANKMIRPTSIPQTEEELQVEQAICREALRASFNHHQRFLLSSQPKKKTGLQSFLKRKNSDSYRCENFDLILGSGGVLSHAPKRIQAASMMLDAFEPIGITRLAVDSVFMLPHLGVLSSLYPDAAVELFFSACLVPLGTAISVDGEISPGVELLKIRTEEKESILYGGEVLLFELNDEEQNASETYVEIIPLTRSVDIGAGPGVTKTLSSKEFYFPLIADGRGRPIPFPIEMDARACTVRNWNEGLGI
jgi:uncharacterized protein (TIGR01319 family)